MAKKHKELDDERKVQKRQDEEKQQPEGKTGKREAKRETPPKRKGKSPGGRNEHEKKVLKAKPALGYQGKCVLNPTGQPRFGKS